MKQDIEKLKTPLSLTWKCCSFKIKIGLMIFSLQWHFKFSTLSEVGGWVEEIRSIRVAR